MNDRDSDLNPMHHPDEQPSGSDDSPRFGRLLLVLIVAVLAIVALTFATEAMYS